MVAGCMARSVAARPSAAMLHQRLQALLRTLGPHQPALHPDGTRSLGSPPIQVSFVPGIQASMTVWAVQNIQG